jgi:hypothetical protein
MNCVNHPEAAVTAFCQNCGKGLCTQCSREVQGNVFCEPCLAARVTGTSAAPGAPGAYPPGYAPPPVGAPNPGTATILGFIPGVGAMYNGQYIKAIVHVLVFVVLISITEHYGMFGIFVGAWVLYQVFDAHQTAKARRDGLPLPDPFGLNELGNAFGGHTAPRPYTPPTPPPWERHLRQGPRLERGRPRGSRMRTGRSRRGGRRTNMDSRARTGRSRCGSRRTNMDSRARSGANSCGSALWLRRRRQRGHLPLAALEHGARLHSQAQDLRRVRFLRHPDGRRLRAQCRRFRRCLRRWSWSGRAGSLLGRLC